MTLLPFKTEYVLTPRTPAEVRDLLAERTGPYLPLFKTTKAIFSGPVDRNGFTLKLQGIGRGPVAVAEGTITEVPQGGGSMVRIHYRLSWLSFALWVWVMVPICAMNYMVLPDAIAQGRAGMIALPLFFFLLGYFAVGMLPFRYQQRRLATSIKAVVLPERKA